VFRLPPTRRARSEFKKRGKNMTEKAEAFWARALDGLKAMKPGQQN
jgi:hypothetical protein